MPIRKKTERWSLPALLLVSGLLLVAIDLFVEGAMATDPPAWLAHLLASPWQWLAYLIVASLLTALLIHKQDRKDKQKEDEEGRRLTLTAEIRDAVLVRLKKRYQLRLDDALEHQIRLRLGLQAAPNHVTMPGLRLLSSTEARAIARSKRIIQVFDAAGQRLLILGEPGAGKTTLLLELAAALVERAEKDPTKAAPLPVILNLASWTAHSGRIRDWVVEALDAAADVNDVALARTLAEGNRLIVLFDGLDEVQEEKRASCLKALNDYLRERAEPAVVCSRTLEYEAIETKLALDEAVHIEPLDPDVVRRALKGANTTSIREALRDDETLRTLVTTPLMLSVVLLAYAGKRVPHLEGEALNERRMQLWDDYIVRMIQRRDRPDLRLPYPAAGILTWLAWLASGMKERDMTDFLMDHVQPDWLAQPKRYRWASILIHGLAQSLTIGSVVLGVLILGLIVSLDSGMAPDRLPFALGFSITMLALALGAGSSFGIRHGLAMISIELEERMTWSWKAATERWKPVVVGVALSAAGGLAMGSAFGWALGVMSSVLLAGLTSGSTLVDRGFVYTALAHPAEGPGARLVASLRNGVAFASAFGAIALLSLGLGSLPLVLTDEVSGGFVLGAAVILGMGFAGSGLLLRGGGDVLGHYTLRFLLLREGAVPWRWERFLILSSELLLLQRNGDEIRFRHILLRDHFAALTPKRLKDLAARIGSGAA